MSQKPYQRPPSLPVPALADTLEQYLSWVRPLVSEEQYRTTCAKVAAFAGGAGPILQEKLLAWDRSTEGSWLKPFWDDSYLVSRGALPASMNYTFLLDKEKLPVGLPLPQYCARIIEGVVKFYLKIAAGEQEQELSRDNPLCMEPYGNVFRACRMPGKGTDRLAVSERSTENLHIAVCRRDNVFVLPVTDEAGAVYGRAQIAAAVAEILEQDQGPGFPAAIYTAADRETAAVFVERLTERSGANRENLAKILDAVFVLDIDDVHTADESERFWQVMFSSRDRIFDKSTQIIVGTDHSIAINNEHTGYDGAVYMAVTGQLFAALTQPETGEGEGPALAIERLHWDTDEVLEKMAAEIEAAHRATGEKVSVCLKEFTEFGKDAVKQAGMSPDAFFHLALQTAYYKVMHRMDSTYEAVSVRQFHQGRTECARPSSGEALAFVKALEDGADRDTLKQLAQASAKEHGARLKKCQAAQGPERHLLGLSLMRTHGTDAVGLPEEQDIFSDIAYQRLKHDSMSTSSLSAGYIKAFGFPPVVEDGFGIGYGVLGDRIRLLVTSFDARKEELPKLVEALQEALRALLEIMQP